MTTCTASGVATRERATWHWAQILALAAGMFIWGALVLKPRLGLHLLWNVLIPVAPALFVVAPGVWRNLCPLGTLSLAPSHLGVSGGKPLSRAWRGRLYLGAVVLLLVVVPLRRAFLDTNGPLLAAVLCAVGLLAIGLGLLFNWKSAWCSSLCPVYPVELLYGSRPVVSVDNAHCPRCTHCVAPCSESAVGRTPGNAVPTALGRWVGIVLTGAFPGFVFGWFQLPTYRGWEGIQHLGTIYAIPFAAAAVTLAGYLLLRSTCPKQDRLFARLFAAAAIMTYYWFRLPPVFGIGDPSAAMFVDLSPHLPSSAATVLRIFELLVLSWLILGRTPTRRAWERPPAAQ